MGRLALVLVWGLLLPIAAAANDIKLVLPSQTASVLSYQFSLSGNTSGNIIHNATVHEASFTMVLNSLAVDLEHDVSMGTHLPFLELEVFKTSYSTTSPYLVFDFKDVIMASSQVITGPTIPDEQFTFAFLSMSLESKATGTPWQTILPEVIPPNRFDLSFLFDSTVDFSFTDSAYVMSFDGGNVTASPEPASLALVLAGFGGLVLRRKKG